MRSPLILGTRGSELALTQAAMVTALLQAAHPDLVIERKIIQTAGDKRPDLRFSEFSQGENAIVDKGIFIKELEVALENGEIDAAVHSLKDVPSLLENQFCIAAVLERERVEDVLISRDHVTLQTLPTGATVGTSSVRRARQLHWVRPDLKIVELRGNVPTRLRKCLGNEGLDAILLAAAGVLRLGLFTLETGQIHIDEQALHVQVLPPLEFYPAAGQGAIAIETRSEDAATQACLAAINHHATEARVQAEREFLRLLGAGCQTPVGAHTAVKGDRLRMAVRVFSENDPESKPQEFEAEASLDSPVKLAELLAAKII